MVAVRPLDFEVLSAHKRYQRILVPIDGSGWSQRAVPHAADIARANHAELILLHVFTPPTSEYADQLLLAGQEGLVQELRDQNQKYLTGLRNELRSEGLDVRTHFIEGLGVASLICDFIENEGVDLVVMSTHGRTGISRFLFGSVAGKVVECVNVPVLLIHPERD